jgi:flagellin
LQRTSNVVNTADASLGEMSDQLIEARAANVALANSAGLSSGEREALQMQMSYAVQSVDRIARQSNFAGNALLDGNTTLHAGDAELTIAKSDSTELGNVTQGSQSARLSDVGSNELAANPALSESVIDDAFATLLNHRAELGAFNKYSVQSRNNALQVELQNTVGAESQIRDTDYAKEVANLVRTKITGQAAIKAMQVDTQIRKSMFDLVV